MFCVKCGAENPSDGRFCFSCGDLLFVGPPPPLGAGGGNVKAPPTPASREELPGKSKEGSKLTTPEQHLFFVHAEDGPNKWVTAYGWLFVVAAVYLLVAGLVSVFTVQATPPAYPFGSAKPISVFAALFQAGLFGVTGWAILRKRRFAIGLVWAGTSLAAIGAIFRGLILLDVLVWLVSLGLAIWYTKASLLSDHQGRQLTEPQPATSLDSAASPTMAERQTRVPRIHL
jgi:hypothetical protein